MKITIDVSTMQNRFAACGRDYYSLEGYEALLAYYNDIDPNMELDAVAICGDCTEYGGRRFNPMLKSYTKPRSRT